MKIAYLILCFLAMLTGNQSLGQKIRINGKESDGTLKWSDFTGKVDPTSSFYAVTSYKFNTKIDDIRMMGDSVAIKGFDVILELDQDESWVKKDKMTDDLLIHEQGHFNIGILCVREIMFRFKAARFTKSNFDKLLQKIIDDASKKYADMGVKYDEETNHSIDAEQQMKWNAFFMEQLKKVTF